MFPEIRSAVARWFRSEPPVSLKAELERFETKAGGGFAFDAVNAAWYLREGYPGIYSILSGGMPAWSGEHVSVESGLSHSVVWACNRVISESIGFTPAVVKQRKGTMTRIADDKPMYNAFLWEPNCELTSQEFRESRTTHAVLAGDAFGQIIRRSGTGVAVEVHPLLPAQVMITREKTGKRRLTYIVKTGGEHGKAYPVESGKPQDILHVRGIGWDGVRGMSVITAARQSLGTALSAERHVARFYANGGRVPYHLELLQKFKTDADFDKFRNDWERIYSEPQRAPMTEPFFKYVPDGLNAVDSQMLETRQFTVPEICRWFRVSPHLVADLSKATFSNIEQLGLEFVTMTLSSWMTRWEQAFHRCVLTDEEKAQGYFLWHDTSAFLKGDIVARFAAYASALQNGHMNQDEARAMEGRDPLPEGEGSKFHIQLNMQELGKAPDPAAELLKLRSQQAN